MGILDKCAKGTQSKNSPFLIVLRALRPENLKNGHLRCPFLMFIGLILPRFLGKGGKGAVRRPLERRKKMSRWAIESLHKTENE